jgi:hypothetical protein
MTNFLVVDFAARYSAAIVINDCGNVLEQFDSWHMTENEWVHRLVDYFSPNMLLSPAYWAGKYVPVEQLILEDLPPSVKFTNVVRTVRCLQGRIIDRMIAYRAIDKLLFVPPSLWQRSMGVWRADTVQTREKAKELGYEPPDMVTGKHYKELQIGHKVETDYVDAYLMAAWLVKTWLAEGTLDVSGTVRYQPWE